MSLPQISVLMPAFNATATIEQAAQSICEQTLTDWECVIVDDGSDDNTGELIREIAAGDSRFVPVFAPHRGLVPALCTGLDMCRAPLVARMDADDRSAPERLEKQAALLDQVPEIALAGCLVRCFSDGGEVPEGMLVYEQWINQIVTHDDIVRDIFVESPFAHPSVMFRKKAVLEAGGYMDRGWPEDYDLWMRLWMRGERFAKCPEVLLEWRDGPQRLSRSHEHYSLMNFRILKEFYLLMTYLEQRREVTIWGAGRGGRWWWGRLTRAGIRVRRFIDIDPRKIGGRKGDTPVVGPGDLEQRAPGDFILGAVESRGARQLIRDRLIEMGYRELEDFLFLA